MMNLEQFKAHCLAKPGVEATCPFKGETVWMKVMDDSLPESLILELVDHSYEVVVASLSKKVQAELKGGAA